jgi:hypothetical protein
VYTWALAVAAKPRMTRGARYLERLENMAFVSFVGGCEQGLQHYTYPSKR